MITTPQELHDEHPRLVSFLLKGLIRWKVSSPHQVEGFVPGFIPARSCDISSTLVVSLVVLCSSWLSTWDPYGFVLLTRNTCLAWYLCTTSVGKFCFPSLHCLIWFSCCSSAWWVPWARMKPVADAHRAIPVVLWSLTCLLIDIVFSFSKQ